MSDVYLVVALVGTFLAVLLTGFAVDYSMIERKRAVRLLEAQVGQIGVPANLREQELQKSFAERALVPVVTSAGRIARRVTPLDTRNRIARKLTLAGSPRAWDAERVAAFKVIGLVAGFALAIGIRSLITLSPFVSIVFTAILSFAGFFLPDAVLDRKVEERQTDIRKSLPDILDLLTISVEAGLSLNSALAQVVKNFGGVMSQEVARMLQEVQLGVSRADAFRHLADRTDVDELNAFTLAMIQADIFGVSISSVLRAQARDLRVKRRQRAERAAQQTPVKIVFPMILCILPALFVVVIGPGAIRIIQNFFGGF